MTSQFTNGVCMYSCSHYMSIYHIRTTDQQTGRRPGSLTADNRHLESNTKLTGDVVIWNFQGGGFCDVITDVI